MIKVNFRLVKSKDVVTGGEPNSTPKEKTSFAIQIQKGWLRRFIYQRGGQLNSIYSFDSKEEAIEWLYAQYDYKPGAMKVHQHASIKLL